MNFVTGDPYSESRFLTSKMAVRASFLIQNFYPPSTWNKIRVTQVTKSEQALAGRLWTAFSSQFELPRSIYLDVARRLLRR